MSSDYSLSKNLKLRGVVFSLEVLVGANASVMSSGVPREVAPAAAAVSAPNNTYDTSREIQGVSTVVSKYGDKLRKRLGGASLDSVSGSGQAAQDRRAGGDAQLLKASKKSAQQDEGGGRWLLVEGMGNILDYTSFRTIPLCCFPLSTQTDALLTTFLSQVHETPWFYIGSVVTTVVPPVPGPANTDGSLLASQFVEMEAKFSSNGIPPKQILVVSSNEPFLALSKSRGFLTCRYRPLDSLYGQVSTDMVATNALEIQDCLEELNGVALRASAFSSRSY